jgi:alpha-tubulin suppressor-like RCC1 family protein
VANNRIQLGAVYCLSPKNWRNNNVKHWNRSAFAATILAVISGIGLNRAIAQTPQGTVRSWGFNRFGQLGDGTRVDSNLPVAVSGLDHVVRVSGAGYYSLAAKADGTAWAWGSNSYGRLGDGTTIDSNVPVQVTNFGSVIDVSAGFGFGMALKSDGTVWTWGDNTFYQLGNGTNVGSLVPIQVQGISNVVRIAAGPRNALALKSDGTVWAWGSDYSCPAANGTPICPVPVQVTGLSNVVSIALGASHSMALKSDGTVWTWGANNYGQLGNGTSSAVSTVPVQLPGFTAASITAGAFHNLALKADGTVWAWGYNVYAQLGNTAAPQSSVPVLVTGIGNIVKTAAGEFHSLALASNGMVWAWGYNGEGEVGNATTGQVPGLVTNLTGVSALGSGPTADHSLAIVGGVTPFTPFASAFAKLTITAGPPPGFDLKDSFTLGASSNGINPPTQDVTLQVGTYAVMLPAGSFHQVPNGAYVFSGVINGVSLAVQIAPVGLNNFDFKVAASGVNLTGLTNPIAVVLTIGNDSGTTSATATFN